MKKLLYGFMAALGLCAPFAAVAAGSTPPQTFVSISTFSAGNADAALYAFQNTSSDVDVRILRIELGNASTTTFTGGLAQYWVYASTKMTHGGNSQISSYRFEVANVAQPSYIQVSTSPFNVLFENKNGSQLPLFRPFYVNNDEAATTNLVDTYNIINGDASNFILPKGANRGIVLVQKRLGTSDFNQGTLMMRVTYTGRN